MLPELDDEHKLKFSRIKKLQDKVDDLNTFSNGQARVIRELNEEIEKLKEFDYKAKAHDFEKLYGEEHEKILELKKQVDYDRTYVKDLNERHDKLKQLLEKIQTELDKHHHYGVAESIRKILKEYTA